MRFRVLPSIALCLAGAANLSAQAGDAPGARVTGVVYDSLARRPLAAAVVQLASTDSARAWARSAVADSMGRYTIAGVPDGRYAAGFLHPMLDSLGLEPPLRGLLVQGEREVHADLAIPSPARLAYTICGPRHAAGGALVMGVVRDARSGEPVSGAEVIAEWLEFTFTRSGILSAVPRLTDSSRANGWFALCDVPAPGRLALVTTHAADSSDRIEVELSSSGFLRRDLYVGPRDSSLRRLSGRVVAIAGAYPVRDALVSIAGGPQVRTNERGEWTLDAPRGTRVLDVHAIGFYPERTTVDVVDHTVPIRTALFTMRAMLDTIKVVAKRTTPTMAAFEERRRSGMGRYLDAAYIERRHAFWTSDLFNMVPGVYVLAGGVGTGEEKAVMLRSPTSMEFCSPAFYLDGGYVGTLGASNLDAFVSPEDIAGIEIYRSPLVPAQFMTGGWDVINCGAIAVWTAPAMTRSRWSWKRRIMVGAALMGSGYVLGPVIRNLMGH